jgi:hypothetical protein
MPKKKKAKKSIPRDYSKSNRKGWITRRRNLAGKKLSEAASYLGRKTPTPTVSIEYLKKQKNILMRQIAAHIVAEATKPVEEDGIMWFNAHPIEFLHKGGQTIAAQPSILRHFDNVEEIEASIEALFNQFRTNKKLPKHERRTKEEIAESIFIGAQQIADEYDVDIREVFTLYHSP